jgi:hypothetical protein
MKIAREKNELCGLVLTLREWALMTKGIHEVIRL